MSMETYQTPEPAQRQIPTWLIEANRMLALSSAALSSRVYQELQENPALELEERPVCPSCGRALQGPHCPQCRHTPAAPPPHEPPVRGEDPSAWVPAGERSGRQDDAFDPTQYVTVPLSLRAQLTVALQQELPTTDGLLIDYFVGNLDEHGYLQCSVPEAAGACVASLEQAERVLCALQAQDPLGVGARNARECLLIQLRFWEAQGVHHPYVSELIDRYLSQLAHHQYGQIAQALQTSPWRIKAAHAFIKARLHPFPTAGYLGAEDRADSGLASPIQPDVVISRKPAKPEARYEIEVVEAQRFGLHLSPSYTEAARSLDHRRLLRNAEYEHVQSYVQRTRLFIANVKRRWQTLYAVTACLVEQQHDFLEQGVSALQPLTHQEVAAALGVHPSTVSRATADKYVMLPNGEVIPFSTFFHPNLRVKAALKVLIGQEERPLSDEKLAERLRRQGWQGARRTIAKYREELKILPSSAR